MKPYTELTIQKLDALGDIDTVFHKKVEYLNIEAGFDIETTSTYIEGRKAAFSYIWMFGMGLGNDIYYGRTWEDFSDLYNILVKYFDLGSDKRIVIYVHNLAYEFQFMRKYFEWEEVFSIKERKPIRALTVDGVEFRDSYILSGMSLETVAKNLTKHKVAKLKGDLDYSLPRHQKTELTDAEMGYCNNDIEIILAYIREQLDDCDITQIPMTNTGRVRQYVKTKCFTEINKETGEEFRNPRDYQAIMRKLTLTPDVYKMAKRAFIGGFTHSNPEHSMKVMENVSSVDLTSSYPTVMIAEEYPMGSPVQLMLDTMEDFRKASAKYCIMLDVAFKGLRNKIGYESYISESKCVRLDGAEIVNGRVYSAELLTMTLVDVDLEIISAVYEWDELYWENVWAFKKYYLPKAIIQSILALYQDKTTLKDVVGREVDYLRSKGMLNSIYGMCVTDIVKDDHTYYDDEWGIEQTDVNESIADYNRSKSRFLYYPWGIWVTAYARRNLWSAILAVGNDYIYSDTDSIKMLNYENHIWYVEQYNKNIGEKLRACMKYYKLDESLLTPKTIKGVEKPLGVWDFEGNYSRFKTVGAKRYLVEENGKLKLTVAGLSKQNGINYMKTVCNNDNTAVFEMFTDELFIPAENTGKLTHTYLDDVDTFMFTDLHGETIEVHSESAVHMEPAEFNLSITDLYIDFINRYVRPK